jgi:dihydroxy-acid dehydratase
MVEEELTARKIMTPPALENAVAIDLAIGGSTNAALHLPAIAHELGFELELKKFNDLGKEIPTLLAINPNGPYGVIDLWTAGGVPAVMRRVSENLHLSALNVAGTTMADVVATAQIYDEKVIPPREKAHRKEGGTVILFGNLAPEGAVVKQSAVVQEMLTFSGRARVMEGEQEALDALREGKVAEGEVLVIRYEGPRGGPGMPETLAVSMALKIAGLKRVALITDGRFSGYSDGPCIGHVSPEASLGGPIAAVRDGDEIDIDIPKQTLNVRLSDREISTRLAEQKPFERHVPPGYMRRYVKSVSSASKGAVLE